MANAPFKISMAAARVNANLTQSEIAKKMGYTTQTIVSWEKGRVEPRISQFEQFCVLCKIPSKYVFLPSELTNS